MTTLPPSRSYLLCTSPRSGSTLLCGLLKATRVAGRPGSLFHEPSLDSWLRYYGLADAQFEGRDAALRAVLDAGIAKGRGSSNLFGCRLQRGSIAFFLEQLAQLFPEQSSDVARLEAAFGSTQFLYLRREDKIAQAISRVIAEQTGLWHRAPDGRELERLAPPREPRYDFQAIAFHVAELTTWEAEWEAWFEREGIAPLRLTYEALAEAPQAVLGDVLAYLKLDASLAATVDVPTAKLADEISLDWSHRYSEEVARQRVA